MFGMELKAASGTDLGQGMSFIDVSNSYFVSDLLLFYNQQPYPNLDYSLYLEKE